MKKEKKCNFKPIKPFDHRLIIPNRNINTDMINDFVLRTKILQTQISNKYKEANIWDVTFTLLFTIFSAAGFISLKLNYFAGALFFFILAVLQGRKL